MELGLSYGLRDDWELSVRLPWERKAQRAGVAFLDSVTPSEKEAILRNAEIHHRSERYTGLGDVTGLLRYRLFNRFREGDTFSIAFGSTIPTGRTEEDPYRLGREGKEHLHIQFGTGTFDPLFEASYWLPYGSGSRFGWNAAAAGRISLYENEHDYRGPEELAVAIGPSLRISPSWTIDVQAEWFHQGHATWNGVDDPNTGIRSWATLLTLRRLIGKTSVETIVRIPLNQKTLGTGDLFDQSVTFGFSFKSNFPRH